MVFGVTTAYDKLQCNNIEQGNRRYNLTFGPYALVKMINVTHDESCRAKNCNPMKQRRMSASDIVKIEGDSSASMAAS